MVLQKTKSFHKASKTNPAEITSNALITKIIGQIKLPIAVAPVRI